MPRLVALSSEPRRPSRRFRFAQYLPHLGAAGFEVDERFAASHGPLEGPRLVRRAQIAGGLGRELVTRVPAVRAARAADVALVLRGLVHGVPTLEPLLPRALVLDVDDAVWLARPAGEAAARALARRARLVTAGNPHLADWYRQHCADVRVVPTSVDTELFVPSAPPERFVVGWTGSRTTLPYLRAIEPALAAFFSEAKDAILRVVSDAPPRLERLRPEQVEHVPWSPAREVDAVQGMSVGLMPLSDTPWSRGKCAFKMVQYLACGVPAIGSPIGASAALLAEADLGWSARTDADWVDALRAARRDRDEAARKGARGRVVIEQKYSVRANAPALIAAIEDAARAER